jgi:hypothetical protein
MGGAFGGGVPLKQIVPLLDRVAPTVDQANPVNRVVIESLGAYGAGIAATKNQESDVSSKVAYMLSPTEFPTTKEGVTSMLPRNKAKFIRETLPTWNLSRSTPHPFTGQLTTHIFHVSSVVDISNFHVTPNVTITDDEKIGYDMASLQTQQAIQLATAYEFSHHPLSDTCVALEHSVIPKFALPKGSTSELLGLIQVDHSGLGFSDPQTPNRAPGLPIVDSIVETVSRKLGGQP